MDWKPPYKWAEKRYCFTFTKLHRFVNRFSLTVFDFVKQLHDWPLVFFISKQSHHHYNGQCTSKKKFPTFLGDRWEFESQTRHYKKIIFILLCNNLNFMYFNDHSKWCYRYRLIMLLIIFLSHLDICKFFTRKFVIHITLF